jgi:putative proteasome-type protease
MTYCVAITVNRGLVFASDSRTNAGVDQLSTYSKMFTICVPGQRAFVVLTAGNLGTTQAVINRVRADIKKGAPTSLHTVESMSEAAEYVGEISLNRQHKTTGVSAGQLDSSASFILGGQIRDRNPKVMMIYPEGNFIVATRETQYLQIGEVKYGKPVLDRIITPETSLEEAALCAMVSMDSTMRSNATVGPPVEVLIYEKDSFQLDQHFTFGTDDPYLLDLKLAWDRKIKEAFSELTRFNWQRAERRRAEGE